MSPKIFLISLHSALQTKLQPSLSLQTLAGMLSSAFAGQDILTLEGVAKADIGNEDILV